MLVSLTQNMVFYSSINHLSSQNEGFTKKFLGYLKIMWGQTNISRVSIQEKITFANVCTKQEMELPKIASFSYLLDLWMLDYESGTWRTKPEDKLILWHPFQLCSRHIVLMLPQIYMLSLHN
jgi:hypothetical protein